MLSCFPDEGGICREMLPHKASLFLNFYKNNFAMKAQRKLRSIFLLRAFASPWQALFAANLQREIFRILFKIL